MKRSDHFFDLPRWLEERLQQPLPGRAAQALFEPELAFGRHFDRPASSARKAAVLILLYPRAGEWYIPLTLRPETLPDHAGQVSFPGGQIKLGEESARAALRETHEELGIDADELQLLGPLSPLNLFVSNFSVQPWLAIARESPAFLPNREEVERLIEIPLSRVLDPAQRVLEIIRRKNFCFAAPCIRQGEDTIWGATGMILAEAAHMCREFVQSQLAAAG